MSDSVLSYLMVKLEPDLTFNSVMSYERSIPEVFISTITESALIYSLLNIYAFNVNSVINIEYFISVYLNNSFKLFYLILFTTNNNHLLLFFFLILISKFN